MKKVRITALRKACSPEASSFKATFSDMALTECLWLAHNGQAPDEN